MHKIDDNRVTGTLFQSLGMFTSLCGKDGMPNAVVATTMWERVKEAEGMRREVQLKSDFFKDMIGSGCKIERFKNTHQSAWDILGSLTPQEGAGTVDIAARSAGLAEKYDNDTVSKQQELAKFVNGLRHLFSG